MKRMTGCLVAVGLTCQMTVNVALGHEGHAALPSKGAEVQGDTLVLRFGGQRVREVEVRGNMSGSYYFASIAKMRGPAVALLDSAAVDSLTAEADSLVALGDTLAAAAIEDRLVASVAALAADPDSLAAAAPDTFDFTGNAEQVNYSGHSVLFDLPGRTIAVSEDAQLFDDVKKEELLLDIETHPAPTRRPPRRDPSTLAQLRRPTLHLMPV